MNITDYVVSEENRNTPVEVAIYFPNCGIYHFSGSDILTFEQIYEQISCILKDSYMRKDLEKIWGNDYEKALEDIEVTVQAETEGFRYFCNFRDNIFERIEDDDVLSLAEERIKKEDFEKEYTIAKKVFQNKQIMKFVIILVFIGIWGLMFLVNKTFALEFIFLPLICILMIGIEMVFARIHFDNGIW